LRKSNALESILLSMADSTLPVGSIGSGCCAEKIEIIFSSFTSTLIPFALLLCTIHDNNMELCRGISLICGKSL
jgi:hypothetical protein